MLNLHRNNLKMFRQAITKINLFGRRIDRNATLLSNDLLDWVVEEPFNPY